VTLGEDTYQATLVGEAPDHDLAVLRIAAPREKLVPLRIGTSRDIQVGQAVYAIGNPFGLDYTLTTGIVSALGRRIQSITRRPIDGVIQTDAAINPGNSGGPLLDSAGRLIGVTTAIYSPSGASAGIGFAVPVNTVKEVVSQIKENGKVEHAYLGVQMLAIDDGLAEALRLPVKEGVLIADVVDGSPADDAGLKGGDQQVIVEGTSYVLGGDIVTQADGQAVTSPDDLRRLIMEKDPGETMTLSIHRGDSERTVSVTLGRQPAQPGG